MAVGMQVELILKLGSDILGDLHSYKRFQQEATDLLDELRTWQQDAFAEWSRDVLAQIDDPNAPIRLMLSYHNTCFHGEEMVAPRAYLGGPCACPTFS